MYHEGGKKRKLQNVANDGPDCKYGLSCYQKNAEHRKKFKHASKHIKTSSEPDNVSNTPEVHSTTENDIFSPLSVECIEEKLKLMPSDFFDLWEFCQNLDISRPKEVFEDLGLHLVGPYDILSKQLTNDHLPHYHCHWRYYYDPPEFQTVIKEDGDDLYHIGYFRDDPSEMPSAMAANSASVGPKFLLMGDNIFAALNSALTDAIKKVKNKSQKEKFSSIQSDLQQLAKRKKYSLNLTTPKTKARSKKAVANTFHGFGIVVPYDKVRDVGYRPLPDSDAKLKSILKSIACAKGKEKRLREMEKLDEIVTNTHFANDEGDFGMGLELGIDLFCYGEPFLHPFVQSILSVSYSLLDRELYAEVLRAHLSNRRKGDRLSILNDQ